MPVEPRTHNNKNSDNLLTYNVQEDAVYHTKIIFVCHAEKFHQQPKQHIPLCLLSSDQELFDCLLHIFLSIIAISLMICYSAPEGIRTLTLLQTGLSRRRLPIAAQGHSGYDRP